MENNDLQEIKDELKAIREVLEKLVPEEKPELVSAYEDHGLEVIYP